MKKQRCQQLLAPVCMVAALAVVADGVAHALGAAVSVAGVFVVNGVAAVAVVDVVVVVAAAVAAVAEAYVHLAGVSLAHAAAAAGTIRAANI